MCIDIPALLSVSLPRFQVGIGFPISSTKRRGCRLSSQRNASPAPLGNPVLRTLWVGCSEAPLGRSAPGAPPARRGSPFLPRNGEKEGRGFAPGPRVYGPLAVARSFWGSFSLIRSRGYSLRYVKTDLGRIFEKIWGKRILRKKGSKSGHIHGCRNSPTTVPLRPTTPKRASGSERAIKKGGAGALPRDSLRPGFL